MCHFYFCNDDMNNKLVFICEDGKYVVLKISHVHYGFSFDEIIYADAQHTRGQFCSPYGYGTSTCHSLKITLFSITNCPWHMFPSSSRFTKKTRSGPPKLWKNILQVSFGRFIFPVAVSFFRSCRAKLSLNYII